MAQCHRTAIRIDLRTIEIKVADELFGNDSKRLVDFPDVNIVLAQASFLEDFSCRWHWSVEHKSRVIALVGIGHNAATGLKVMFVGIILVRNQDCSGSVDNTGRVPRVVHASPFKFGVSALNLLAECYTATQIKVSNCVEAGAQRGEPLHSSFGSWKLFIVERNRTPAEVRGRYDLSSLQVVIHAAAPCPVEIKQRMFDWLGPIIYEYYGGSEGNGSTRIGPEEWLRKPGSVGKASWGVVHICDDEGNELPIGDQGLIYFEGGWDFKYLDDETKTRDSRNPLHPTWTTLGDIGYLDEDGYLFLTDRKSYMIISGGVNIYPQEIENLLITHPKVADAAVIGVPNPEFGEEVKAVVQPLNPADATPEFAEQLVEFCRESLSSIKCPRSVDFERELPRLDNGKLYKRLIKDRYWNSS